MIPFAALHTHSTYSLLDGGASIDALVKRVVEEGQSALAITDHGNLHGAWHFQKAARKHGIKPIIGMEAYVAPGSRHDRERVTGEDRQYHHLVLLARDVEGYRNLCKLSSRAYSEGFYHKPRVDHDLLREYAKGLVVTSACMAGEVARALEANDWTSARAIAAFYADVFQDRYYLEVQAHGTPGQAELNAKILRLAEGMGLPVVATNDAHFLSPHDHQAHDALVCIGTGRMTTDADRLTYDRGLYFKSGEEMAAAFPGRPDVLENTMAIAESVNVTMAKQYHVPNFPVPATFAAATSTAESAGAAQPPAAREAAYLRALVADGLQRRYGHRADPETGALPEEIQARAEYELGVIETSGYAGYFLIVADFIGYARAQGIPVGPGRGSGAGSIVAYATEITDVCPLAFGLLFERFLNPERVSMPDVDVDLCFERRGEVIEYVRQKYGREAVAQIATFGTLKARAAITDVGRVMGFSPTEAKAVAALVPNGPGLTVTIAEAEAAVPALRELATTKGRRYGEWLDTAKRLEGLARHIGVHAAGLVIAPGPVEDYVPTCTVATKGAGAMHDGERALVTQFEMGPLEEAGMLKMDFLGLTTLTVCHHAVEAIAARHGVTINLRTLPLDDAAVYAMLAQGDTAGVFQFESQLATDTLRAMRVDGFEDLVTTNALLRPGPLDTHMHKAYIRRKRGEEPVSYLFPELEPILETSLGILTFQEQLMRVAQVIGGFSLAEADILRKAVGKKDAQLIEEQLALFVARSVARGFDRAKVEELADLAVSFGRYGFNRSHAVAYSVIAYHTAYLKTHYPAEFWAALLTAELAKKDKLIKYMSAARARGLSVSLPDINESGLRFTVVGPSAQPMIRFPLNAIDGVGSSAAQALLADREAQGPYQSFEDLVRRATALRINKKILVALIEAGALDNVAAAAGSHRAQLVASLDAMTAFVRETAKDAAMGQGSLFGGESSTDDLPRLATVPPWSPTDRLVREHRAVRCFLSGHPLEQYEALAAGLRTAVVADLTSYLEERQTLPAIIVAVERRVSKRTGNPYADVTVEDLTGQVTCKVFAETLARLDADGVLQPLQAVLLQGGFAARDAGEDQPTFMLDGALRLDRALERMAVEGCCTLELRLAPDVTRNRAALDAIAGVLREARGLSPVHVIREAGAGSLEARHTSPYAVRVTAALLEACQAVAPGVRATLRLAPSGVSDLFGTTRFGSAA